jgi:hypothetical protein
MKIVLFVLLLFLALPASAELPSAAAILADFDRAAELPLWPGFAPKTIPVAIYDGTETWLARHPAPPAGFVRRSDTVWSFPGQHPLMRANTSVDLGGTMTATLLLNPKSSYGSREWAAVLIHECFHVFQRLHHPAWTGNEGELFLYPVNDSEVLTGRRLETEALRRALAAPGRPGAACWASRAMEQRRARFARMPAGSVGYERWNELNEGLASYLEDLAQERHAPDLPADGYGPDTVRTAVYGVGPALADLLDRFDSAWKTKIDSGTAAGLDQLLTVDLPLAESAGCSFTAEEKERARAQAGEDTAKLVTGRKADRAAFFARPGVRLVIEAGSHPLGLQGFDPLNMEALGGSEVLHKRLLQLSNDRGTLEVFNREALTEGADAGDHHPLFAGVRTLTLSGLAAEPKVTREGETVKIETEGFTATLKGALVETTGNGVRIIRITWPPDPPPPAGATPPTAPGPHSSTD